ncbi:MAG: alpha/beta fold hydrolase [Desulforegulaceae bacterium]|nr:alpha/beta fold hydrolase [Desulforegulaceae bacterium]
MNNFKKLVGVLIIILIFTGCSRYKIHDYAIESTRKKADLESETVKISKGEIVYLNNFAKKESDNHQDFIIMVHGFGANKDNWLKLSAELTEKFKIAALDLPGHGESFSDLSNEYNIENQAKWLNEFMEALNIKKAHIIGNSMGGGISAQFSYKNPDKVLTLTLIDSAGIYKTDSDFTISLKDGKNPLVVENMDQFKELMDLVMEKKPYIPGPVFKVLTEKKIKRKSIDQKIFEDMSKDIDLTDTLKKIKVPVLIVWGKKDRVLHVDNAYEFKNKIKGSSLVVFDGIGHLPMMETPEKTADAFLDFLEKNKKLSEKLQIN